MKIGYQGDVGSNSEEATKHLIQYYNLQNAECFPLITSENVVDALENKNIDLGVMAVENSIAGEVEETAKAIKNKNIRIRATLALPIHHCIFVKNKDIEITRIVSHIQALKQTANTRKSILPNIKECEIADTAIGARNLSLGIYDNHTAVICRKSAGDMYNLYLIAENIEDKPSKTLFILAELR